jgi:hypothetical protein
MTAANRSPSNRRSASPVAGRVDDALVVAGAHAPDHAPEYGLGHGIAGLEARVGLQRDLAATVGSPDSGAFDRQLLACQGRDAPLVTIPSVTSLGLALVSRAAEARDLVLQEGRGDE